jgi:glycosyltransferase involved in cell wall biosynthesis
MKLDIITVNLNNRPGLEKTIRSVMNQTDKTIGLIVIDGASADGSRELLSTYREQISYGISERDNGVYDAMNKGIQAAKGDYLLFLNSGDTLSGDTVIESVLPELESNDEVVYGNLKFNDGGVIKEGFMPDKIDLEYLFRDTLWHPASFIRGDLFSRFGLYNTSYRICGDYDFFFRVISAGARMRHINQFIAEFDLHGMSSKLENHPLIKMEKTAIQKTYLSPEDIEIYTRKALSVKRRNFFSGWFR